MTLRARDSGALYRVIFGAAALSFLGAASWILTAGRGDTVATAAVLLVFGLFFIILLAGVRGRSEVFADNLHVGKSGWFYNRQVIRRYPRGSISSMRLRRNPLLSSLDFLGMDGRVIFSASADYSRREIEDLASYLGIHVQGLDESH